MNDQNQTADLVFRLRDLPNLPQYENHIRREAAHEIERLRIRVARLEGYSDGLRERITNALRALGCNHD